MSFGYYCPNGHEIEPRRRIIAVRCETPGCTARTAYTVAAIDIGLHKRLKVAEAAVKRAVGCEHPDTCGGPLSQPICAPCIAFAKAHLWTSAPDPIECQPPQ